MQRRAVIAIVSLTLLASVVAAALVIRPGSPVALTLTPNAADRVMLYQNGLASVSLSRSFDATPDGTRLTFALPPTVVFDSVRLEGEGVTVKEIRSTTSQSSGIHPGDEVIVHVDAQKYAGTIQAIEDGTITLRTPTGLTYVEMTKATAIEITKTDIAPAPVGSLSAEALVIAPLGSHNVTLSYLLRGPGWTPTYALDADTGDLVFFATLTAADDWHGVSLDLMSGSPHLVYTPSVFARDAGAPESASKGLYDASFGESTQVGDLHRYHYDGTINLSRGEAARLVVAEGKAKIVRSYHEIHANTGWGGLSGDSQNVAVLEKLQIQNDLSEPLPAGTLRAYRGGEFVGEDTMESLPKGDATNVTLATSQDIKAKLTLVSNAADASKDAYSYSLSLRNFGGASDVRVVIDVPTFRTTLRSFEPPSGVARGGSVAWDAQLGAGESQTFAVSYETLKYG